MNRIKKGVATVLVAATALMGLSAAQPGRAEAAIGAAVGSLGLAIAGVGTAMAATIVGPVVCVSKSRTRYCEGAEAEEAGWNIELAMLITGLIVLDHGDPSSAQLAPLGEERAARLGLSGAEAQAYNDNLDELNAVADQVGAELARAKAPGLEASRALWNRFGKSLDQAALATARKVVDASLAEAMAARK